MPWIGPAISLVGGSLMGGGSQEGGQITNTQQQYNPFTPYLGDIANRAQQLSYRPPGIDLSQDTRNFWDLTRQRALAGSPVGNAMQTNLTDTLNGRYLDPASNPYLRGAVDTGLGLAKSNVLGLYGGNAGNNINNSGFQEQLTRTLAEQANNAYAQNYSNERTRQMQAASMAPAAAGLDYQDLGALGNIGAQQNAVYDPWTPIQRYAQTIGMMPSPGGSSTSSSPYFTNPMASMMGGAMGIYGMGQQSGLWGSLGNMFSGTGGNYTTNIWGPPQTFGQSNPFGDSNNFSGAYK